MLRQVVGVIAAVTWRFFSVRSRPRQKDGGTYDLTEQGSVLKPPEMALEAHADKDN